MTEISIRLAKPQDAEAIRTIYNWFVNNSTATFDLVERSVIEHDYWMRNHQGIYCVLVACVTNDKEAVAGYASLSPYRDRAAYATSAESSIYVSQAYSGQGIGTELLKSLVNQATSSGFHSLISRIEATNLASIKTHEKCGYFKIGEEIEIGRKFNKWLNVAIFERLLR